MPNTNPAPISIARTYFEAMASKNVEGLLALASSPDQKVQKQARLDLINLTAAMVTGQIRRPQKSTNFA